MMRMLSVVLPRRPRVSQPPQDQPIPLSEPKRDAMDLRALLSLDAAGGWCPLDPSMMGIHAVELSRKLGTVAKVTSHREADKHRQLQLASPRTVAAYKGSLPVHPDQPETHESKRVIMVQLYRRDGFEVVMEHSCDPMAIQEAFERALALLIAFHEETGQVHGDVKWENIVEEEESGTLRLIDFESTMALGTTVAEALEQSKGECVGTFNFAAPELFRGSQLGAASAASDGYSLAASTVGLLSNWNKHCEKIKTQHLPVAAERAAAMGKGYYSEELHQCIDSAMRLGALSESMATVLKALTRVKPDERISLQEALQTLQTSRLSTSEAQ